MSFQPRIHFFLQWIAILVLCSGAFPARAQEEKRNLVNYAYAVLFGTGVYKVNDQKAFVLRIPFSYRLGESSATQPGATLLLPVLAGYYDYNFDDALRGSLPGEAATQSFVPGLQLDYHIDDDWRIQPYGQFGIGRDLKNNENAWIYLGGLSSLYMLPGSGTWRFSLAEPR